MSKLIVIFGPVGVGKSTVSNLLCFTLNHANVRTKQTFLKAFQGPSFLIWYFISRLLGYRKIRTYKHVAPWLFLSSMSEELAWKVTLLTALIDAFLSIPLRLFQIKLSKFVYDVVICEEYLFGTLEDYLFTLFKTRGKRGNIILRYCLKVFVSMLTKEHPSMLILIDANIGNLVSRWKKRGYGDPQPKYVLFQKIFLKNIFRSEVRTHGDMRLVYIDTSDKSPVDVLREVLNSLNLNK